MKQESMHYSGHYGVRFNVTVLTILPADRAKLREMNFGEIRSEYWKVRELAVSTYDRMLAQQLPCEMSVAISRPLTREQADLLNAQRTNIANIIGAAVGAPFKRLGAVPVFVAGAVAKGFVNYKLDTHHVADVIVAVYARVSGGIGPQSTSSSLLIKAKGGIQ